MKNYEQNARKFGLAFVAIIIILMIGSSLTKCEGQINEQPVPILSPDEAHSLFQETPIPQGPTYADEMRMASGCLIGSATIFTVTFLAAAGNEIAWNSWEYDGAMNSPRDLAAFADALEKRERVYSGVKTGCIIVGAMGAFILIDAGLHLRRASVIANENGVGLSITF